jgi:shikimate kinase
MAPVVVLVGPPGSGKSTTAVALAARIGVAARDTDADVEAVAGSSVGDLFVEHGEEHFRDLERAAVAAALEGHDGVLAVGGGAVLDAATRQRLAGRTVVFLDVGIKDAATRIGLNRDRPLLLGNPRAQWISLMAQRRPVYEEVATVTVRTDGRTPEQVAEEIVRAVGL